MFAITRSHTKISPSKHTLTVIHHNSSILKTAPENLIPFYKNSELEMASSGL